MKFLRFVLFLAVLISFASCKDEHANQGSLSIRFKPVYDGLPLPLFQTKPFTLPQQLQFSQLSFFISDLALLDQASQVNLRDLELVNLSFNDATGADEGWEIHMDNVPAKNYSGLHFGLGLPPDLNAKKPEDFTSSNPLSNPNNYWMVWDSYIFMKIEGRLDTLGAGNFDTGFAYHTGTDKLYRIVEGNLPIAIEEGKEKIITISVDYKTLLQGVDIKSKPLNSNPKDSVQIGMIVDHLPNALTIYQ